MENKYANKIQNCEKLTVGFLLWILTFACESGVIMGYRKKILQQDKTTS